MVSTVRNIMIITIWLSKYVVAICLPRLKPWAILKFEIVVFNRINYISKIKPKRDEFKNSSLFSVYI